MNASANTSSAATPAGVIASCFGFMVIGAQQALYGPAIPYLMQKYDISPGMAGMSLSAHFLGGVLGVLLFHGVYARFSNRSLLGVSYALMAIGCIAFAYAPSWPLALGAAFTIGLGYGGMDFGLNFLFSVGFGKRSVSMVNLINAHFGVGAIAAPALIAWIGAQNYQIAFVACAVGSAIPLLALGSISNRTEHGDGAAQLPTQGGSRGLLLLGAFLLIYVFHVAIETGVGGWEPTHLEDVGYAASFAAAATAVFWLMMTLGRFLSVFIGLRWSTERIMLVSCAGMALCLAAATIPAAAPYAYAGVGLFIAPLFPTGLAWLNRCVPEARSATAYVIAAAMLGGVIFPPLIGEIINRSGTLAAPLFMALLAFVCLLAVRLIIRVLGAAKSAELPRGNTPL
ncbi:MAG: MFS transporter [Acidihalobacter sp.]|uniref:MFS transporter n=1 Tax=Acidihalobacter sp. TaxID=1872108 RepID=UPI00307CDAA3